MSAGPPSATPEGGPGVGAPDPGALGRRLATLLSGPLPPPLDARVLMSAAEMQAARPAAVLVAVAARAEGPGILLTRRNEQLPHHGGQISFAGGRVDPADPDRVATALREASEEIGLDAHAVQVLGTLPEFFVPSGFRVTPVLAWLDREPALRADPAEVAEIFYLPAAQALDPDSWQVEEIERQGRRRTLWVMHFEGRRIWGATAAILVWLGNALRLQGSRDSGAGQTRD